MSGHGNWSIQAFLCRNVSLMFTAPTISACYLVVQWILYPESFTGCDGLTDHSLDRVVFVHSLATTWTHEHRPGVRHQCAVVGLLKVEVSV